jgi:integrase
MPEDEANLRAERIQKDWEFLVTNWEHLCGKNLRIVGSPFAETPHWRPALPAIEPTPAQVDQYQDRPPTAEDMELAFADVRMKGVQALFDQQLQVSVAQGDIQQTSYRSTMKSLRNAVSYFADDLRMADLTHNEIQLAKTKMLEVLGRRTVRNRMSDLRRMLSWFYDSDYGRAHERPTHFESVFTIKNAIRTDIKPYTMDELKQLLAMARERERLYVMLALNCGMYQSDIGRLTLDEVNVDEGFIFWDREKEPQNPFRVKHELWPETRALVVKFLQPRSPRSRPQMDWRAGRPVEVDCARLAFIDDSGNMLYRITESGRAYDKVGRAFDRLRNRCEKRKIQTAYKFQNLRKSTNQMLCELIESRVDANDPQAFVAASEIAGMFLAQKSPLLTRLYRQTGMRLYTRMNRHLMEVGDQMRTQGLFPA